MRWVVSTDSSHATSVPSAWMRSTGSPTPPHGVISYASSMTVKAWITPASDRGATTLAKLRPTSLSRSQPKNRSTDELSQQIVPALSMSASGKIEWSTIVSKVSNDGPTAWISSMRLPKGSSVWTRRMSGTSSAGRTSWPASTSSWHTTSRSSTSSAGWALAAGRKSASTPRWMRTVGPSNQQPPRAARASGLATRRRPRTPP